MAAGQDRVFFNVVFGTEEFPEFIGTEFIDAFGIYLNGVNIAGFSGLPINVDHPNMAGITGTELDGVLDPTSGGGDPIMQFEGLVAAGSTGNTLTFIIADSGDGAYDATAYIQGLGSSAPGGGTPGGGELSISGPPSISVFATALFAMGWLRRRRKI